MVRKHREALFVVLLSDTLDCLTLVTQTLRDFSRNVLVSYFLVTQILRDFSHNVRFSYSKVKQYLFDYHQPGGFVHLSQTMNFELVDSNISHDAP